MQSGSSQEQQEQQSMLLALPEPLLLAVLQCLAAADDHRSLFSTARAHSRLHQAAVAALGSVTVQEIQQQHTLSELLLYLGKHGQHVRSILLSGLEGSFLTLLPLPPTLQLHSLELRNMCLQLAPGNGWPGVLGAAQLSALKQLRLDTCVLLGEDDGEALAAALEQLPPGLEHLSLDRIDFEGSFGWPTPFPMDLLQRRLHQLTHLELQHVRLRGADQSSPSLQPLQALSRLVDLRLGAWQDCEQTVTASMLSGAVRLTRLELMCLSFEPGVLAGKTQLQHLSFSRGDVPEDEAWTAQLLAQLASLQQLTYLQCAHLHLLAASPLAAYSALTASSKLQLLCLTESTLPAGVWQHMFPAGRQLPHLTQLDVASVWQSPDGGYLAAPEGSRLVSCCPGLQWLDVRGLAYSPGAFGPLQALSGLRTLAVSLEDAGEGSREVCQLTGLRQLTAYVDDGAGELVLLQLTQLRQLTRLEYEGPLNGHRRSAQWVSKAPGDEPVWRQVLRAHLNHSDPAVAQQAAAALAEAE